MKKAPASQHLQWQCSVPIFRHPIILRQLSFAFGLPFGILGLVLLIVVDDWSDLLYPSLLIGALFCCTWLFILIFWRGRYEVESILDATGVRCRTQKAQAKKNIIINTIAVILGLFMGKPGVAGAGMLAQARQDQQIRWKNIRKVQRHPKSNTILVHGGFAEHLAIFCTAENYTEVDQMVRQQTGK